MKLKTVDMGQGGWANVARARTAASVRPRRFRECYIKHSWLRNTCADMWPIWLEKLLSGPLKWPLAPGPRRRQHNAADGTCTDPGHPRHGPERGREDASVQHPALCAQSAQHRRHSVDVPIVLKLLDHEAGNVGA